MQCVCGMRSRVWVQASTDPLGRRINSVVAGSGDAGSERFKTLASGCSGTAREFPAYHVTATLFVFHYAPDGLTGTSTTSSADFSDAFRATRIKRGNRRWRNHTLKSTSAISIGGRRRGTRDTGMPRGSSVARGSELDD